jgi:hypothetical protein
MASTSRSSALLVVLGLGGFFCFRSRVATRALYAALAAGFLGLVLLADVLLDNLDGWQQQVSEAVGGGEFATQMSRVGTYSDRLRGFSNLAKNPDVYTLFGYGPDRGKDERDPLYSHDLISNILVTHGLVPLLAIMGFGVFVLARMHRGVFLIGDKHHRLLAAGFLSLAFSLFALSALSGSVLAVFPVNTLLWLCFGLLMLVYQSEQLNAPADAEFSPETVEENAPAVTPRPINRFRRSGFTAPGGTL